MEEREEEFIPRHEPPEEERFRRRWERAPLWEMATEGEPHQIFPAVRGRLNWMEQMTVLEKRPPNTYPALLMAQEIVEREQAVRSLYPLGLAEWPPKLVDKGYDKEPKRTELADTLKNAHEEMQARLALLQKVHEQLMFSADVEIYLLHYFTRWGKSFLPSADYGRILNAKETYEGFAPFGKKVETAFGALLDIGKGEAKVTLENGRTKSLPNIFALPPNRGLTTFALDKYILPKLKNLRKEEIKADENKARFDDSDNFAAALVALELFRHWDYDVYYCFGRRASGESFARKAITPEEWEEMALEIGAQSGDSAKAMWFEARRAAEHGRVEWGGTGRREHPRAAGNPMSFGCYPMLTTHMLDIVTTDMVITPEMAGQIKKQVGERAEIPRKVKISVHDRCFENQTEIPVKVGNEEKHTAISYTPIPLSEILWDDAKVINADTDEEWLEFALGPQSDAYEIPYKLQGFYAFLGMYQQVMRTDFLKQYEEITRGDLLRKMNKQIQTAIGLMATGFHLREKTANKLSNYIRCVFLGTLAAGVETSIRRELERGAQVVQYTGYKRGDEARTALMEAARICSFLTVDQKGDIDKQQEKLLQKIQKDRRPILPKESGFFTEKELEEIKPLYPLGL